MTVDEFLEQWHSPEAWVEAHTSGSTGKPKLIRLLKSDMLASARATNQFFGLGADSLYHCPLSINYIAGKMMAVRALASGGRYLFTTPSVAPEFVPCSLLAIVPAQVEALLQSTLLSQIGAVIIGGAALSDERRRALASAGVSAFESYGMTETCSHVALRSVNDNFFRAMPGVSFELDSRGCLVVNVPHLYINKVSTNDIVELIDASSFRWLGRYDNIINTGGIKVIPEQLESILQSLGAEPDTFYITSAPDERWGNRIIAVVQKGPAVEALGEAVKLIENRLRPKETIIVDALPRTDNGKIQRRKPFDL